MRAVWTIPTQPYSGSHFATYPEELVIRCLKASTSEKGACPKCGAAWIRMVEKEFVKTGPPRNDITGGQPGMNGWKDTPRGNNDITTIGWRSACKCGIETTVPCKVADFFVGSGTTIVAARRLGLDGYGSDLSMQYLSDNARERIDQDAPRF